MIILADENIPLVEETFQHIGEVVRFKGRELKRDDLVSAEVLLVRSVTKVDAALVEGTPLRFVGTATIGTDHVDAEALSERGISFVSAPGSNSNSVGEYVIAALLTLAVDHGRNLDGKTLGIVGVGNCGSRVEALAPSLGLQLLYCDPPLAQRTGDSRYRPLMEIADADILTFHVPLTKTGPDPTYHMINAELLERRPPDGVLINSSRGAVADSGALVEHFSIASDEVLLLDVWEGEPDIRLDVLNLAALGTPHIAGYSYDGKVRGMLMLYRALCGLLGVEPEWLADPCLAQDVSPLKLQTHLGGTEALDDLVRTCYDIRADDRNLRQLLQIPVPERASYFDALRKGYRVRREFPSFKVSVRDRKEETVGQIDGLGFQVVK